MRLDRNVGEKVGKYSIIENRKGGKIVHNGDPVDDFVVLKLRDINTPAALLAYAKSAEKTGDRELAEDFRDFAAGSGKAHPHCKVPD